jgi:trigger factor
MSELHHMISLEELDNDKFQSTVTFDGELVKSAIETSAKIVNKSVKINGFRQGKVPLKLLKRLRPEKISANAMQMLMDEGFKLAVLENRIMPLGTPKLLGINVYPSEEEGFEYQIEFEGMSEIDPVGYLSMSLEVPKYNVENSIQEYIKYLKSQHASLTPTGEEVEDGSFIKCDYVLKLGDKDLGKDEDQTVPVYDTEKTIFGSQLVGTKAGDTRDYDYVLPEDFPENPGEKVVVSVSIKEVLSRKEPSMEELAKSLGATEEQVMEFAQKQVVDSLEKNKREILNNQVMDKLLEANPFNPPKSLVDAEIQSMKHNHNHSHQEAHDCHCDHDHTHDKEEGCEDHCGENYCSNEENKGNELREAAEKTVKSAYILNRIYNMESNLALTKDEINTSLDMEAQSRNTTRQVLLKQIKQNNMYEHFIGNLRNRKIMTFILSNATVVEQQGDENVSNRANESES